MLNTVHRLFGHELLNKPLIIKELSVYYAASERDSEQLSTTFCRCDEIGRHRGFKILKKVLNLDFLQLQKNGRSPINKELQIENKTF
ncbi:hypothetical protein GZ77_04000 [Endozoicomonas montiporae]|uniref:Uncharacterized protein n=2 Tax=Endozoicomonas montiporae TaxID=1027273 RepID=A0A081NBA4_9GAMM|nr:hypothetical protein EZMO1_1865 [Endozoicomonas montiporae CL-33]KEQ15727.1 hypothetical protein GZ77_04000 [Endozoicomonas montiporae]